MKYGASFILFLGLLITLSCSNLPLSGNTPLTDWLPFTEDFTAMSDRWHREVARDGSMVVENTALGSNLGPKMHIHVTPQDIVYNGNRAELALYHVGQYRDTVYYGFDFLIPADDPQDFTWQILSQWYQLPDFDHGETFDYQFPHPPVYLALEPGKLVFMTSVPQETRLGEVAVELNTWYRVVVKIHFAMDTTGSLEFFFGPPEAVVPIFAGPRMGPTLHNRAGIYWKLGLYRGYINQTQAPSSNGVYIDNIHVGREP